MLTYYSLSDGRPTDQYVNDETAHCIGSMIFRNSADVDHVVSEIESGLGSSRKLLKWGNVEERKDQNKQNLLKYRDIFVGKLLTCIKRYNILMTYIYQTGFEIKHAEKTLCDYFNIRFGECQGELLNLLDGLMPPRMLNLFNYTIFKCEGKEMVQIAPIQKINNDTITNTIYTKLVNRKIAYFILLYAYQYSKINSMMMTKCSLSNSTMLQNISVCDRMPSDVNGSLLNTINMLASMNQRNGIIVHSDQGEKGYDKLIDCYVGMVHEYLSGCNYEYSEGVKEILECEYNKRIILPQ